MTRRPDSRDLDRARRWQSPPPEDPPPEMRSPGAEGTGAGSSKARTSDDTPDQDEPQAAGSGPVLSNSLTDMAERIRQATTRAAEAYLEAGRLLVEAKAACGHGHWLPFLERAGVHERQARRMMRLAKSGLTSDTVSEMGIKAALGSLAEQRPPRVVDVDDYIRSKRPPEDGEIEIPIDAVTFRPDLYPRLQFHRDLIDRYHEFLPDLPPIEINQRNELIDGWHHLEAHRKAGAETIRVVVTEVPDDLEHLTLAVKRNATHGVQLPIELERKYAKRVRQRPRQRPSPQPDPGGARAPSGPG